jgi:hypothetical protein
MKFTTRKEAAAFLKAKGLKPNKSSGTREYWWFGDGTDVFLDHSATLTGNAPSILLSDFTSKRKMS